MALAVVSVTHSTFLTDTTSHLVAMPATVNAGNLLILFVASDGSATITTPSGWTLLYGIPQSTTSRGTAYCKIAAGTEGGTTLDLVTSAVEQMAAQVYRITGNIELVGAGSVEAGTPLAGGNAGVTTIDPPGATASWGAADNLFITALNISSSGTLTSGPSGWGTPEKTNEGGGGQTTNSANLFTSALFSSAATGDPTAWTVSATGIASVTGTIVVRPRVGTIGVPVNTLAGAFAANSTTHALSIPAVAAGRILLITSHGRRASTTLPPDDGTVADTSAVPLTWYPVFNGQSSQVGANPGTKAQWWWAIADGAAKTVTITWPNAGSASSIFSSVTDFSIGAGKVPNFENQATASNTGTPAVAVTATFPKVPTGGINFLSFYGAGGSTSTIATGYTTLTSVASTPYRTGYDITPGTNAVMGLGFLDQILCAVNITETNAWSPAEVGTDLIAWYDFADTATVIQSGGFLTQWQDKSGNARHGNAATTGTLSILSDGIYIANGTMGANLGIQMPALPSAYFDFAHAGKPNPAGSYRTLMAQVLGGQHHILIETGTNNLGNYSNAWFPAGSLTWPSVDGQVYFVGPNSSSIQIGKDGATPIDLVGENFAPDNTPFLFNYSVNGGQGWGTAREFVFMTASRPQAIQDKVSGYLAWKWDGFLGVATHVSALPSIHPYKSGPPPTGIVNAYVSAIGASATTSVGTVVVPVMAVGQGVAASVGDVTIDIPAAAPDVSVDLVGQEITASSEYSVVRSDKGGLLGGVMSVQASSTTNPTSTFSWGGMVEADDLIYVTAACEAAMHAVSCFDNLGNTYTATNAGGDAGSIAARAFFTIVDHPGFLATVSITPNTTHTDNIIIQAQAFQGPFSGLDANPANTVNVDLVSPYDHPATGTLAQADELLVAWSVRSDTVNMLGVAPLVTTAALSSSSGMRSFVGRQRLSSTASVIPQTASVSDPVQFVGGTNTFKFTSLVNGFDVSPNLLLNIVFAADSNTTGATINTTGPFAYSKPAGYDDWVTGVAGVNVNAASQFVNIFAGTVTVTAVVNVSTNLTTNVVTASVGDETVRHGASTTAATNLATTQLGPVDIVAGGSISVGQTTNVVTASVGNVTLRSTAVFAATNLIMTSVGDENVTTTTSASTTAATNLLTVGLGNESVIQGLGVSTTAATNLVTASVGDETVTARQNVSINIVMPLFMTVSTNPVTVIEGFRVLVNAATNVVTVGLGNESVAFPMAVFATGNQVTASTNSVSVIQPVTVYVEGQEVVAQLGVPGVKINALTSVTGFPLVVSYGNEAVALPRDVAITGQQLTAYVGIPGFILHHHIAIESFRLTASIGQVYSPNWGTTPDDVIKEVWIEPAAGPPEGWTPLPKRQNAWTVTPDVPDEIWNRQTHPPNDWTH